MAHILNSWKITLQVYGIIWLWRNVNTSVYCIQRENVGDDSSVHIGFCASYYPKLCIFVCCPWMQVASEWEPCHKHQLSKDI